MKFGEDRSTGIIKDEPSSVLAVIDRVARDPAVDVSKLERLLAIQQTIMADQRAQSYAEAMARLQPRLPQIRKDGRIVVNDVTRSRFARLEDIDTAIRPLLAEEGFSFSFDSEPVATGIRFSAKLSHRDGHSETKTWTAPADASGGKNAIQAVASTTSYARRHLIKMHLNVVEREEDDDGNGGQEPVTQAQADEIKVALVNVGGDEGRFLKWIGAPSFETILAGNYPRAMRFIAEKATRGSK